MGVKDLMKVIKDYAPSAIYNTHVISFKNKKVAIDTSIWAYRKFIELLPIYIEENEEEDRTDFWVVRWEPLRKRWLGAMLEIAHTFLKADITPIFIFEDTSAPIKLDEHERREEKRIKLEENFLQLQKEFEELSGRFERSDRMEKYRKAFANQIRFDHSFNRNLFEVFKALQIPVYYSVEESDLLISSLVKEGIVDAVYSTDTDLIVYGIPYLITGSFGQYFSVVKTESFLSEINFTTDQLIDLAILLGTDYNRRVRGVGPVNSVRLISTYRKLELIPQKYYTSDSRRSIVRKRFKEIPSYKNLLRYTDYEDIFFEIDCAEILTKGAERLQVFRLNERWEKFLSSS